MSGCARIDFLRAQRIARVVETRNNIVVCNARVIRQNIGLTPSVGHQTNHEFDRKPRSANDRFAGEHVGGQRNARMVGHGRWVTPLFKGDVTRT